MRAYGRLRCDYGCCPGHDRFPNHTYNNNRSKRARSRDKKALHQLARQRFKREFRKMICD